MLERWCSLLCVSVIVVYRTGRDLKDGFGGSGRMAWNNER